MSLPDGRRASAGSETGFALAGTALVVALLSFSAASHELWRDEMGPWLIARDSASPLAVLRAIRYDGHPPLWFLLLWPCARLTRSPVCMQLLNAAIVGAAVFLLLLRAPASRGMRLLAASGYFLVYEYGTIAREYGLSVLCLAAICLSVPARRERPLRLGLCIALAAFSSPPALILGIALLGALSVECLIRRERALRPWAGLCLAALACLLSARELRPPPDGAFAPGWHWSIDAGTVKRAFSAVAWGYLPIPRPGPGYWQSHLLDDWIPGFARAPWIFGGALALVGALALARSPLALGYFVLATGGLLTFFSVKYFGYLRHHGFLFLALGTAAWIAAQSAPPTRGAGRAMGRRAADVALGLLLAAHLAGTAISVHGDWKYRFSASAATAALMRSHGIDQLELVGSMDFTVMPVVGYLQKARAFYPAGARFASYVTWDRARTIGSSPWAHADRLARTVDVSVVVDQLTHARSPPPASLKPRLSLIGCERGEVVTEESYCVFVLHPKWWVPANAGGVPPRPPSEIPRAPLLR